MPLVTNVPKNGHKEEPLTVPTLNFSPDAEKPREDQFVIVAPQMIDPNEPPRLVPTYLGLAPLKNAREEPLLVPKLHFEEQPTR